jgi:O-acetylhomoserine/O-acetylserine sulfhydrylase-like pyridoxal-dependent enzyme
MAAIHAALLGIGIETGDTVVVASDLYGVTRSLLAQFEAFGVETRYVDILDLEEVERVVSETRARALYFESISNPLLRVADVDRLVEIGRTHHALTLIDNTFATRISFAPPSWASIW